MKRLEIALQEQEKLKVEAVIGKLAVHIEERSESMRIVGITENPYVVENGGVKLIAEKLDFLFDDTLSFDWFVENVHEGYEIGLSREKDEFLNLDDLFDIEYIEDTEENEVDIPGYVVMAAAISR
ncbi:MAG: hypothetical protein LRY50_09170 [Geovibrio sp.]|jgi:hypothetical protein|uniref:hypothetical protein n=1 Tax=Geovibrio ferrireducens TaxID=46201 RepID=UPI002245CEA4|nr:hypothetical protein [Geovibrio ferrireducens]MCD8568480.1 hypothetical protein [Geovibrio sp.]